ncbi:hypothetical protein RH858_12770 [Halalkaliarchaeum sp. AArc-GB]|uniref:hypothetical protein n=1 Tax=Halalkaliarchaeum sp. AArc-GB TaxID=3074078 RepID=UPI0028629F10|nr:hypothetical protein [Halalkaliarchaeum sp. AArc-GB]MDR5674017.1 hypothetical protein [Halalkaliarchaeum sp. AArc-GB]
MERRKLLIGMGSLAVGGAAAMGSGAFTSVDARRDIRIVVSDDNDALLTFNTDGGENTKYSELNGDTLSVDISGDDNEGLNLDATTTFLQLFEVENQGSNVVGVKLSHGDFGDDFESVGWFVGDEHNANDPYSNTMSHEDIQDYEWGDPDDDLRILEPGESVWVGAYFHNPDETFSRNYEFEIKAHTQDSAEQNNV